MAEHPIPDARVEASAPVRLWARLMPVGRFLKRVLPGVIGALIILGALGAAVYGINACCAWSDRMAEQKREDCVALNWQRDRVDRIVRTETGVRVYVRDDPANPDFLREYGFGNRAPFLEIVFMTDVPEGQPMRFVSTAVLEPNEQCVQRVVFHVRSARDIE